MQAWVEQEDGNYKWEERPEPKCGEAYCDNCGDCMFCSDDEFCYDGALHRWVIYKKRSN